MEIDLDAAVSFVATHARIIDRRRLQFLLDGGSPAGVLAALDAYRNVATGYTGTVHFSSSDSQANLPGNYTFTAGDSAGLAVLLEWLGLAKQAGRQLHYTHLPQDLTALAGISELQELLARGV